MRFPFGETVTLVRAGETSYDEWGEPHTVTEEIPIPRCGVAPRTSNENTDQQETVTTGLSVYLPAGTQIRFDDEMRVRGHMYRVDGEPGVWHSPLTGWQAGVEVSVRRSS